MGSLTSACLLVAACGTPLEELATPPADTETARSELNGMEGMFEFAIDLPWRIEPRVQPDGLRLYDPVPITLVIHDEDTNPYSSGGRLHQLCKIEVSRYRDGQATNTQSFVPSQLEWMEYTGRFPGAPTSQATYWPLPSQGLSPPSNAVCHPAYQNCNGFEKIYDTSEWHGLLKWNPGPMLPGYRETLQLVAFVSSGDGCGTRQIRLVNYARAHWAYDPLPRFGDERWLYGDLHYHSQSTDNEGESGYSYRAVAEAMGAMGIDFTYATDHASDAEQIVDVDRLDFWDVDVAPERRRGLRDLNQARWDAAQFKLGNLQGANADLAASWPQDRARVPRLFLGAEVDVMPEVALAPPSLNSSPYWSLPWGNHRLLNLFDWTTDGFIDYFGSQPTITIDDLPLVFRPFTDKQGLPAYVLGDVQGWNKRLVGRQHVLHLPRFAQQPTGFVASRTGLYGGASRHLVESSPSGGGILPEIASKQGLAFLAHPLNGSGGGPGPGMAPYSDYQYAKIFAEPALTGLQLWNEDARMSSGGCFCGGVLACACPAIGDYEVTGYDWLGTWSPGSHADGWNDGEYRYAPMFNTSRWTWQRIRYDVDQNLHNGAYVWDRLLRWGLDQGRTADISWLPAGEPRRLFMAGGSDAHGDWNYRREGYMRETSEANDTAFAKVRNLVFAGHRRTGCRPTDWLCFDPEVPALQSSHEQDGVNDALSQGKFSVTDGPAVRLVVDRNRNGVVDDQDYPMGSVVELYNGEALPVLVQWQSTSEFGAVERVDLYVGVDANPQCTGEGCLSPINEGRARTYAPPDHGARRDPDEVQDRYYNGVLGKVKQADPPATACGGLCQMQDGYWLPAEGTARQNLRYLPTSDGFAGTRAVSINFDDYPSSGTQSARATRGYVRAFVRTKRTCDLKSPNTPVDVRFSGDCVPRYGFTNPVWALRRTFISRGQCVFSDRALDRDLDGAPDFCDAAPDTATPRGWTRLFGGALGDVAAAVAFDGAGTAFVAGETTGSGRIERTQQALASFAATDLDAALLKYSNTGELLSRFQVMGVGAARLTDVAVDFIGNVYVTGTFNGTAQIGINALTSSDGDAFVAKLRGADLSLLWLHRLGGVGYGRASGLTVTSDGQVVVVGDFTGALESNGTLTAEGGADCFVLWLANTGAQLALQRLGGAGACTALDVAGDNAGHVYVAATYGGQVRVGLQSRTTSSRDSLVARFGSAAENRVPGWVGWIGDPASGGDGVLADLAVLPSGDVVAAGWFNGTLAAGRDGGAITALGSAFGGRDGFVVRLAGTDGAASLPPQWRFGGSGDDALTAVATDSAGRALLTGWFQSTTVSTALGGLARASTLDSMSFLLDPQQQLTWQVAAGTTGSTLPHGATFSRDGRMALVGTLAGQARFDPRRTVASLAGNDGYLTVMPTP